MTRWWAAGVGVAVLVAGALVWWFGTHRADREDELRDAVRAELTTKARDALENGAASGRLACAVRVLGTDPPAVTDAAQARTVFVHARCATVGTEVTTESSQPAAVHLTDPATVEVPGDGAAYGPDIERIFPPRLRDLTDGQSYDLEPELRRRIQERT